MSAFAVDSEMIFTGPDLKVNTLVQKVKGQDDEHLSVGAARVLQLQLNASGCNRAIVNPHTITAAIQYKYTVDADNCAVKLKSQDCDEGFGPKDMMGNPHTPDYAIIGAEKYKVCVKGAPAEGRPVKVKNAPAPTQAPAATPAQSPEVDRKELLKQFNR